MFLTAQGGVLGPISWLFGELLNFIYNLLANDNGIANLGLCIIIFTIVVKVLTFPLTFKQQKSAKINMFLQPEIQKIQKKYKDKKDQESMMKQQQEMQAIYDKYGTSMTAGCLPALIQFPIIMALYRVIQNIPAYVDEIYKKYANIAEGIMTNQEDKIFKYLSDFVDENKINAALPAIKDLEKISEVKVENIIDVIANFSTTHFNMIFKDLGIAGNEMLINEIEEIHSFILGINIFEAPGYKLSWALLIPLSSAFFQYLSMKIASVNQSSDAPGSSMMKTMQITMPLMSIFITISLPAGIGIYWAVGALISVITQLIINFYYDHADMDAILEKQMAKAAKKLEKRGGKKTFMQRMMDQSQAAQEELEKREAMKKNSASSLRNYVPSEESKKAMESRNVKNYKEGSLGSKANIMLNYNNDKKGEK